MPLRDMYDQEELPTRPDTPNACARRCKLCGLVYGEHADIFPIRPDAACFGVKCNFQPEANADADAAR